MQGVLSILAGLFLVLSCLNAHAESGNNTGEAKISSQDAVQKVDNGNPVLQQNMMQHTMQAQMYEAQKNFGMASQEQMKAQMLQQQIDQNDQSRQKNDDREHKSVFSAAPPGKELKADPFATAPTTSAAGRPLAPASNATVAQDPNGSLNKEVLVLDDSVAKQPPADASTPGTLTTAPDASGPTITAPSNQADLSSMVLDLKSVEADYEASQNAPTSTSISVAPISEEPRIEVIVPEKDLAKLIAKKEKEKEDFWKTKKPKAKQGNKSKRAIAKVKASKKPLPSPLAEGTSPLPPKPSSP